MSANKKKIIAAAESVGVEVESIEWVPLGKNYEMMGRSGGWKINGECIGQNTSEAIDFIQRFMKVAEQ